MSNDEQDLEPTPQETDQPPETPIVEPISDAELSSTYFTELGKQFLNSTLSEATAMLATNATHPTTTTRILQYDGPSDTVYIALHKGEHLTVTPDMEPVIQRLLHEGFSFSPVD